MNKHWVKFYMCTLHQTSQRFWPLALQKWCSHLPCSDAFNKIIPMRAREKFSPSIKCETVGIMKKHTNNWIVFWSRLHKASLFTSSSGFNIAKRVHQIAGALLQKESCIIDWCPGEVQVNNAHINRDNLTNNALWVPKHSPCTINMLLNSLECAKGQSWCWGPLTEGKIVSTY